ncbi:MAG: chemotaxis protein CheW [Oscillospiraceae bacterium]|nr:chemotaxis protein CheW [Oscillospiraceae bacterium]
MDSVVIDVNAQVSPYVLFSVADNVYGVSSNHVLSIEILGEPTSLVNAPPYTLGILDFRGDMIQLIGLRKLFGLQELDAEREMLLVFNVNETTKGIVVDDIVAVEYINQFLDLPENSGKSRYVRSLARRDKDNSTVQLIDEELIIDL